MKRLLFLPVLFTLLLFSCKDKRTGILNHSNLTSSFISIDAGKDNALKTPKGAIIKIAANSFDVPAGTKVTIEIKEAYSVQDILKAGLTTMSNGKLLQSGGMIYFNASVESKPVNFLKPVAITIPSKLYNDSMKVFKGEITSDSSINWIEPRTLDTSVFSKELAKGKALFKANCASCHKPDVDMTGPALKGVRSRTPTPDWAYKWLMNNNVNTMLGTDPYAKRLLAKWGSRMTAQNLAKEQVKAILDYCDNEAALNKAKPLPGATMPEDNPKNDSTSSAGSFSIDCGNDTVPVFENNSISILPPDSLSLIDTSFSDYAKPQEIPMYSFSIDQSGWYNVDYFINNNIDEVRDVVLTVSLKGGNTE
ncbi:MAG: cytochrome c, partial [Bacteroidota bacterium]